jgi:ribosomal protein S7
MKGRLIILKQTITPAVPETQPQPMLITKRIGSTTYHVTVHFSRTSRETIDDKIIRLIRNETASGKAVVNH